MGRLRNKPQSAKLTMNTKDTYTIPLTQDQTATVSPEDYEWAMQVKWTAQKHGNTWYAVHNKQLMHRSIAVRKGLPPSPEYDHENHCGTDNRRENIRLCTHTQNMGNRRKQLNTSSRFKGVSKKGRNKWRARIEVNGKAISLGSFTIEEDAAAAYAEAAKFHFAEFAFPDGPSITNNTTNQKDEV